MKRKPATRPLTAAQANARFWTADMQRAGEAMRATGDYPGDLYATQPPVRVARQQRAALTGRPVSPLPTRTANARRRKVRKAKRAVEHHLAVIGALMVIFGLIMALGAAIGAAS